LARLPRFYRPGGKRAVDCSRGRSKRRVTSADFRPSTEWLGQQSGNKPDYHFAGAGKPITGGLLGDTGKKTGAD